MLMTNESRRRSFWSICVIAVFVVTSPAVFSAANHNIYLTAAEVDEIPKAEPATEFSCSDKIYAVLELRGLSKENHQLDALWRDPQGKDREHTEYEFQVQSDMQRIWVWLKLHRPPEAALVSFMNPSAGMDEFIGTWELRLIIDGETIEKKSFSILC